MTGHDTGTPFAPHTPEETAAMLDAVGAETVEDLFDVPDSVRFDGEFGIESRDEQTVRAEFTEQLDDTDEQIEFLGRGHYDHYVPSAVEHLADRSEFLTSYTQYQPEVAQGFLQALFEYQSIVVELTGLDVANCSLYDAATALGEAALLAKRVRATSGDVVLVPELLREERRSVLENYVGGTDLRVEAYPHDDGVADVEALRGRVDADVAMVYAESPTVRGTLDPHLAAIGDLADEHDALFTLGSDPIALSVLERPAVLGADVVVGDASVLGLPASFGTGLGLFATRDEFLRQVPGRLVGASEDADGNRAYTLTLQTREQHIRKERATSNVCTNQAWVALRSAMHAVSLGPEGLVELAQTCIEEPASLAATIDDLPGYAAPVHDKAHFREFVVETDASAATIGAGLREEGFAVHVLDEDRLQLCVTDTNREHVGDLVEAMEVVR
ncbi:glycine dehydrogenase subunit 1 [Salinarchaeum sp. Harcht-Bsk1]|uniref:aminomethyl-transferring glycine dehydrogenase subunit GcvPA n=1 Tax=Salinarchaeum sp. Harcht-Bsk1 TaxID=1333523 RepID=UPI00034232C8|nr:aminomethyl-transferring glycine dehydrogenase subunit GcvPA [Salinarchaeum sp. Harcht-Bsk1]AGN01278.1 glycine dehydrogenase subunit 1 [Salinarchaeum sp. Harcht-Bsk1]